jgi:hypothetical protein
LEFLTMRKLALLIALLNSTAAFAAEHAGSGNVPTLETGWSGSNFATLSASNVWAKRAYKTDVTILKDHTYFGTLTLSGVSAGSVEAYVTGVKMTCPGSWENVTAGTDGLIPIPDNFDSTLGIVSLASQFSAAASSTDCVVVDGIDCREHDANGSFRFNFNPAKLKFLPDDPIVCPGKPGYSHFHMEAGNTGWSANSTYKTLRTTGGTSAGDSRAPLMRAAYWWPAMLDGRGYAVVPLKMLTYYKTIPTNHIGCNPPTLSDGTPDLSSGNYFGKCVPLPHGLKYIFGADMATTNMLHGPMDSTNGDRDNITFKCTSSFNVEKPGTSASGYHNLDDVRAAGCTIGDFVYVALTGYPCWDGKHTDSPNHRDHMSLGIGQVAITDPHDADSSTNVGETPGQSWTRCPQDHPYLIPTWSEQFDFRVDADFVAGRWHFACDENMTMVMATGACFHADYMDAWSPYARDAWQGSPTAPGPNGGIGTGCINGRNNGNFGSLCNGYGLKMDQNFSNEPAATSQLVPLSRRGWSRAFSANGVYHFTLRAASSGELGLYGIAGFTATSVNLSITDVTNVGKVNSVVGQR